MQQANSESPRKIPQGRRASNASEFSCASFDSWLRQQADPAGSRDSNVSKISETSAKLMKIARSQTQMRDEAETFTLTLILSAVLVAACCGVAAFALHLSVRFAGCLGGVNGCHRSLLFDALEPLGISKSVYFIVLSGISGLICSLIINSSFAGGVAKECKGGGTAGTKITISAGKNPSAWIAFFRIVLASLYMGGGNTLGTEGPIIHLSAALATSLAGMAGSHRRKILSIFGVIGAAAGISAGFNVLITGFIYTIEELTRTLSRKVALIITLAAAVAIYVKDHLETLLHHWFHDEHASMVPDEAIWAELTTYENHVCLLLSILIGILNGVAGWVFTRLTWSIQNFMKDHANSENSKIRLPEIFHLAAIGIITGCFGAVAYEVTGVNGVWGTTIDAIPATIKNASIDWKKALLLFAMKFISFVLATAGGGPGGLLVPSLIAGGFMGLVVGLFVGGSEALTSACAVVGMGSLFSSVLHLPVSGIIIVFELTRAHVLILHVVVANFIASNVATRLPSGQTSFVHLSLEKSTTWAKLGGQDFIETDDHEHAADSQIGCKRLLSMKTSALKDFLMTDSQRVRGAFQSWLSLLKKKNTPEIMIDIVIDSWDGPVMKKLYLHKLWGAWRNECIRSLRSRRCNPQKMPITQGDPGLRPSFFEDVYENVLVTLIADVSPSVDSTRSTDSQKIQCNGDRKPAITLISEDDARMSSKEKQAAVDLCGSRISSKDCARMSSNEK